MSIDVYHKYKVIMLGARERGITAGTDMGKIRDVD